MIYYNSYESAFEAIKDRNEVLLWVGKPKFLPFIAGKSLFSLIFIGIGITMYFNAQSEGDITNPLFYLVCIIPIVWGLWRAASGILSYPKTFYGFTERKVLIQTGANGEQFTIIEMNKIVEITLKNNFLDRAFGTGTIKFFTGVTKNDDGKIMKVYDEWESVSNHMEVFRELNKAFKKS